MYLSCQGAGWERKRGKLSPSTLLSSLFVPLLLPCRLPSIYTPLEKIKTRPYAWLPCECAVLHVYYGSTVGERSRPFSCVPVIAVGQRAAGGRDVLRKQSHVTSCTAAGGHSLLEDLSLLSAYHTTLHKELFIWVSQRDGESACPLGSSLSEQCTQKLRGNTAFCYQRLLEAFFEAGWYLKKA